MSKKKYDYEHVLGTIRFFEHQFVDKDIFQHAQAFLAKKKEIIKGNFQSRCGALNQYKKIMRMFFESVYLSEITKNHILSKLEEHFGPWTIRLHFMWEFLFFLKDKHLLDSEWNQLEHLRDLFCTSPRAEWCKLALTAEDSLQCRMVQTVRSLMFYYFDTRSLFLQELIISFFRVTLKDFGKDTIFSFLFESQGLYIHDPDDFTYDIFKMQLELLRQEENPEKYISQLINFYIYVYTTVRPDLFSKSPGFDARILYRNGLAKDLADGYRIVPYNPMEGYPRDDCWIMSFYGGDNVQYYREMSFTLKIDFSKIECPTYRGHAKEFLWFSPATWIVKRGIYNLIFYFLNYIWSLKNGKELTVYTRKTNSLNFGLSELVAFRQHILWKYSNIKTQSHYFSAASLFLRALASRNIIFLNPGILEQLKIKMASGSDKKPIPDGELQKLSVCMQKYAKKSIVYTLYYSVFYLALETDFRLSQILNLTVGCVQETLKKGQYVIVSKTKSSQGEYVDQAITTYTKKHLNEIMDKTQPFRRECTDPILKSLLYTEPYGQSNIPFRSLNPERFGRFLKQCCREAGIPEYTFSNLRDTHMTKAEEFVIRNGLSDMQLGVLSGHKSPDTTRRHYSQPDFTEMLEAVHGIIIGDLELRGRIEEDSCRFPEENTVSNGCGYCGNATCILTAALDCLMCRYFVTTPDRIPYFEEGIAALDYKITHTALPHDVEDLVNIKRLFAAYLKELLQLKTDT